MPGCGAQKHVLCTNPLVDAGKSAMLPPREAAYRVVSSGVSVARLPQTIGTPASERQKPWRHGDERGSRRRRSWAAGPLVVGWLPRQARTAVHIPGIVRMSTGQAVPVTVIDVSDKGCKVRCLRLLPVGDVVQIEIPAFGLKAASVRWWFPGRAGLSFL